MHPDQNLLHASRFELTGGSSDGLSSISGWANNFEDMCDGWWEGIVCYESGPNKGAVREISLDYAGFTGRLPSSWSGLKAITSITLSNNGLKRTVPASWKALTKLTELRLENNALTGDFPAEDLGAGMTLLRQLGVHNNPELGGCLPTAWQGRSFSMMIEGDQTVAVGAGGTVTLKTRAGPLLNTKIVNWCGLPDNGDPPPNPCIKDPTLPTCQNVTGTLAAGQ